MRLPFFSMFAYSPFNDVEEHAKTVVEASWTFQQAIRCVGLREMTQFDTLAKMVTHLEGEADMIKRRIRGHIPKETRLPVDKFQLFRFLREQDHVIDAMEKSLDWISYRPDPGIPPQFQNEYQKLTDMGIDVVELLGKLANLYHAYFNSFAERERIELKEIVRIIRDKTKIVLKFESEIKRKIFSSTLDGVGIYHAIRLAELIGSVASHAENAGDHVRAMVSR